MMMTWTESRSRGPGLALIAALAAAFAGCSSDKKEPDCVPAVGPESAPKAKIVSTPLVVDDTSGKKDNDWCRACVMGPKGYASCQRVYGDTPEEPRDKIRERARVKACVDSGYTEASCPPRAIIGQSCKGDPAPAGAMDPGDALQNLYQKLNPDGVVPPKPPAKPDPVVETDASGKPKIITVE